MPGARHDHQRHLHLRLPQGHFEPLALLHRYQGVLVPVHDEERRGRFARVEQWAGQAGQFRAIFGRSPSNSEAALWG